MNTHADKTQENKSQSVSNGESQMQSSGEATFQFVDNRPEAVAQRKLQEIANNRPEAVAQRKLQEMANISPQAKQATQLQAMADSHSAQQQPIIQKNKNNTGLPDNLKTGMENLSGMSLDDVKVHRNSDKPAQLQAHAYAQGTDIHLASGQEKHLPHEAWHVVQQKQGRVKPTMQMKGKVNVNDDVGLEKEADVMGAKASSLGAVQAKSIDVQGGQLAGRRVSQMASKAIVRNPGMETTKTNTVTWTDNGKIDTLKVDNSTPLIAFLSDNEKELFNAASIASVERSPDKNSVFVYPKNRKHGIWKINIPLNFGGDAKNINPIAWAFIGDVSTSGILAWKQYYATGRMYLLGVDTMTSVSQVANKVYANMLGLIKYTPGGTSSPPAIIQGGNEGQCHAINGALGILIQAALAYKGYNADTIATHTHDSPFVTPDKETISVIKGEKTNIVSDNGSPYVGNRIKFDNHMWITVEGNVYDLVAGIINGGASCVDQAVTRVDENNYTWEGKNLIKAATPGAPWSSGYAMTD